MGVLPLMHIFWTYFLTCTQPMIWLLLNTMVNNFLVMLVYGLSIMGLMGRMEDNSVLLNDSAQSQWSLNPPKPCTFKKQSDILDHLVLPGPP